MLWVQLSKPKIGNTVEELKHETGIGFIPNHGLITLEISLSLIT